MITLTKQTVAEYIEKNPDAPFWQLNFKKIDDLMMIGDEYFFVCRSDSPRGKAYWEQVYPDTDIYVDLSEPKKEPMLCLKCGGSGKAGVFGKRSDVLGENKTDHKASDMIWIDEICSDCNGRGIVNL